MDTNRWQHLRTLLYEALQQPAEKRAVFLTEACGDDADLRTQIEALIAAHEAADDFLETPPTILEEFSQTLATQPDGQIGPYRLVRALGEGGMGEVFLAERADGLFERQVALKLVKRRHSETILRRFEAERRMLARLQHPHIAQLLDGGTTADGRPYFAMEYVDGAPLTTYAVAHNLTLNDRLRLIADIGDAIQHAHRNLIVHRDLKPSNLLITEDENGERQVRLLDFGIAKLLEDEDQDTLTETGARPMTRAYAAPEQIRGEPITTATDVYALGAVMYELLTGHRPFQADTPHALEQAILATNPAAPSTAAQRVTTTASEASTTAETHPWAKRLEGDLDVVCLKALRKEPDERYASAEAFVADIRRYLADLPVTARPPTRRYRLRKFVQRHRTGVALSALITLLIVVGTITVALQAQRVATERDRAEEALAQAEEVSDFMLDLFRANDPNQQQEELTAADLLAQGVARTEDLADQPAVQARMLETIGNAYKNMGRYPQAESLLTQSLTMYQTLHGETHENVAEIHDDLNVLYFEWQGNADQANHHLNAAVTIFRTINPHHPRLVALQSSSGAMDFQQGRFESAEARFVEALAAARAQPESNDALIATILNNLAITSINLERLEDAASYIRESLALNRAIHGEDHPQVATNLNILGEVQFRQGRLDLAALTYQDVLARRKKLYGDDHPAVAAALNNLAQVYRRSNLMPGAIGYAREALAIQRKTQGPQHPRLGLSLKNLGTLLTENNQFDESETILQESLTIFRIHFDEEHRQVIQVKQALYKLYTAWGKPEAAAPYTSEGS